MQLATLLGAGESVDQTRLFQQTFHFTYIGTSREDDSPSHRLHLIVGFQPKADRVGFSACFQFFSVISSFPLFSHLVPAAVTWGFLAFAKVSSSLYFILVPVTI